MSASGVLNGARAFASALCGIAVAGCAIIDQVVDSRVSDLNRGTEAARNEAVLLNIVRASRYQPLNFVTVQTVGGDQTAKLNMGLPQFLVGADRTPTQKLITFGSSTLNTNLEAKSNFNVAVVETKDFYLGLLKPVDVITLYHFERQGYPRGLLFRLFTDAVRVTRGTVTTEYRNEPDEERSCAQHGADPRSRRCFSDYVRFAVLGGLRAEATSRRVPVTREGRTTVVTESVGRLCFDPVIARRAQQEAERRGEDISQLAGIEYSPVCGTDFEARVKGKGRHQPVSGAPLTVRSAGTSVGIEIITRSTFGIYQFLGKLLEADGTADTRLFDPDTDDPGLLTVLTGVSGACFVEADYSGRHYCVPAEGAQNTKRIFSLLVQLLALQTSPSDLPIIPTIRLGL